MKHTLFVYGTLRKGGPNWHLLPFDRRIGYINATLWVMPIEAYEDLPLLPTVYLSKRADLRVIGDLIEIDDDWLLRLDIFEQNYSREKVPVYSGGEKILAWVYMFNPGPPDGTKQVLSGDYIDYLQTLLEQMEKQNGRS
jgi:gamma-glutamylcyclotransferase (GGCT)/AIG2-like uncharacterized protein YtfP